MKTIKFIWSILSMLLTIMIVAIIVWNYIVNDKQPSNFEIYIALLFYIQTFIKHKDNI